MQSDDKIDIEALAQELIEMDLEYVEYSTTVFGIKQPEKKVVPKDSALALAQRVAMNDPSMTKLFIDYPLDNDKLKYIAASLTRSTHLQELCLSAMVIDQCGVKMLAKGLAIK